MPVKISIHYFSLFLNHNLAISKPSNMRSQGKIMTHTTWNLKELRDYAKSKLSDADLVISQIDSIDRTVGIFIYHMSTAKKLIEKIEPRDERDQMNLIFTPASMREQLWEIKLGIQAETQAAIHNARSIHEIFSQIGNSLLLDQPMAADRCTILSLSKRLRESKLKNYLEETLTSDSYQYVNSFVNTIKHRNLVKSNSHIDLQEARGGIKFEEFNYNNKTYPSLWAIDVIKTVLEVKNRAIIAGPMLNSEVRNLVINGVN